MTGTVLRQTFMHKSFDPTAVYHFISCDKGVVGALRNPLRGQSICRELKGGILNLSKAESRCELRHIYLISVYILMTEYFVTDLVFRKCIARFPI